MNPSISFPDQPATNVAPGGSASLIAALTDALGAQQVLAGAQSCAYYANDIFWQPGVAPVAIVLPRTRAQAVAAVLVAAAHEADIVPRGGGMSYTKGYLPERAGAIVVDTRKLHGVVEVNVPDRYITVEAGCTWAQVHQALERTGMSTGYWGPLSGINATVGGALAQNSAFFGSTLLGTVAESVLGVTVLLALRPAAQHVDYLGFGFTGMQSMALAQVEMSAVQAISEGFGIDRAKALNSASVNKLADGQGWVPIHALFPLSEAARVVNASAAYFESQKALIDANSIILSHMTMTVGNQFFLEPAFYWEDEIKPLQRQSLGDDVVRPGLGRPANTAAREVVIALRKGIQQVYLGLGGVNWQIGRDHPLQSVMQPQSWGMLTAIKRVLDPQGRMNPGSLGLRPSA